MLCNIKICSSSTTFNQRRKKELNLYTILTVNVVYLTSLCWELGGELGEGPKEVFCLFSSASSPILNTEVAVDSVTTQLCLPAAGLFEAHLQYLAAGLVFE